MFRNFLRGRYGTDSLSFVLLLSAVLLSRISYLWIISVGLFGFALFRILSKDINKRYQEQLKFEKFYKPLIKNLTVYKTRFEQRKQYVFLQCPKCKKTLRLPKNKGKLQVNCPVCKFEFLKKT
jgi:ssDNA-binding Zn-finger/Zn-ribbon topoisomerase 1